MKQGILPFILRILFSFGLSVTIHASAMEALESLIRRPQIYEPLRITYAPVSMSCCQETLSVPEPPSLPEPPWVQKPTPVPETASAPDSPSAPDPEPEPEPPKREPAPKTDPEPELNPESVMKPVPRSVSAELKSERKPVIKSTPKPAKGSVPVGVPAKPVPVAGPKGSSKSEDGKTAQADQVYLTRMIRRVRAAIFYPRAAVKSGSGGVVHIGFTVDSRGHARDMVIRLSSGIKCLDLAARSIVTRASPFGRPPDGFSRRHPALSIPLNFTAIKQKGMKNVSVR